MINIDEWLKELSYRLVPENVNEPICIELVKAIDGFLESLKDKGLSNKTIKKYQKDSQLFVHELIKDYATYGESNRTLKDYENQSFMPNYFCINRTTFKYDEKELNSYENRIDKFWKYYSEAYLNN